VLIWDLRQCQNLTALGAFVKGFRQAYPETKTTVYLRTTVLGEAIRSLPNTTVVHGDLEKDLDELKSLISEHDIVINMANSRDTTINSAIVDAIRNRKSSSKGILLHLSGTGNFSDNSKEGIPSTAAGYFVDTNPDQVRRINSTMAPNGPSDEILIKAALDGDAIVYFVCPAGIYGASEDHIARLAGESASKYYNTPGVWAGWMIQNIETLGFSPYVGPGNNIFWTVHVDDVVSLIMLVYKRIVKVGQKYKPEDVTKNWYIAATQQHEPKNVAEAFGEMMARKGKIPQGAVRSVPYDQAGITARYVPPQDFHELFLLKGRYLAGNMLIKAENGQQNLGWQPNAPTLYEVLEKMY
jgi:nucleoside-diphosphate-sugar epimerase